MMPSSAVFAWLSGPRTFGGTPPLGRLPSRTVEIPIGAATPTTPALVTLRVKLPLAGNDGLTVAVVGETTYSNLPAGSPSVDVSRIAPAASEATAIVDLVTQAM